MFLTLSIPFFSPLTSHSQPYPHPHLHSQVIAPSRASRSADANRERGREKEVVVSRNPRSHKVSGGRQRDTPKGFYTDINDSEDEGRSRNDRRSSSRKKRREEEEESEEEASDDSDEENNSDDSSDDDEGDAGGDSEGDDDGKESGPAHWTCLVHELMSYHRLFLSYFFPRFCNTLHRMTQRDIT